MSATVIHGKNGKVYWDSGYVTDPLVSWNLTVTSDSTDVSYMGSAVLSRIKLGGLKDWTVVIEAVGDDSGFIAVPGATGTIKLELTGTVSDGYLSGTGFVKGISVSQDPSDAGKVTYTIQGSGTLAWAVV